MPSSFRPAHAAVTTLSQLRCYQGARQLCVECHLVVRQLPPFERSTIGEQLLRAALSVKSNIAEGHGRRGTDVDFRNFLRLARGSAAECFAQLEMLNDAKLANVDASLKLTKDLDRQLSGFIHTLSRGAPR